MKNITSTVQSLIDGKQYGGVILVKLDFDRSAGPFRYANVPQNIYWDEGAGEEEYVGVGNLGAISVLPETNELSAVQVQLTLSGIPAEHITESFSDNYRNRPIHIWYGILDTDTYAVQPDPILAFAGLMDYSTIEFGNTCTITLTATSRLADWERARGGRFSDGYQRKYVDPSDDGFTFVAALQNVDIQWGGRTSFVASDPKDQGGGGDGDPTIKWDLS